MPEEEYERWGEVGRMAMIVDLAVELEVSVGVAEEGAEAEVEGGTEVELGSGIAWAGVGLDGVDGDKKDVVARMVDLEDTDAVEELHAAAVGREVAVRAA